MYLFCPKCRAQHPAAGRCPKCSSRLLSPGEAADSLAVAVGEPPPPIEPTVLGRLGVGCVVALGLHLALLEWTAAALGPISPAEPVGFLAGFLLRLLSACVGGVMAGAGRKLNFSGGAAVGLASGFAWLLVDGYPAVVLDPLRVGLVAVVVAAAGLIAMAAGQVWPEPVVVKPVPSPHGSSLLGLKPTPRKRTGQPTRWVRIAVGAAVAVGGVAVADEVRLALRGVPGLVNVGGPTVAARVDFQLAVMFVLAGSVIAGSGTKAGLRHGMLAGALVAVGVLAVWGTMESVPSLTWLADATTASDASPRNVQAVLGLWAFVAVSAGGWLGSQLLPPLKPKRRLPTERY